MKRHMKPCATGLVLVFLLPILAISAPPRASDRVWITNVIIVSPDKLDRVEKGSVLIENGRIAKVDRGRTANKPSGATVFSGGGQYLVPGLIDSHVHLASVPGLPLDDSKVKPGMVSDYFKQLPRSYLYFGYTTLVDLAVVDQKVLDEFRGAPIGPDLYDCGPSLPMANGYPMSFAPPEVRFNVFPNFIYDVSQADRIPPQYKPEEHTPAADVARAKASGAVCAKTYFERGFARDRKLPVINSRILAEIRRATTKDRLVLMIHANSFEGQQLAVERNVDVIAHGMWHWGDFDKEMQLPDQIKRLLDQIVAKKIGYQPTIQVLYGETAYFDPEYLNIRAIPKVVPKQMVEWFRSPDGKWFGKELAEEGQPDAAIVKDYEQGPVRRVRQVVAYLASQNANFIFGTDTPSAPTYGNLPGLNGYLEMMQLYRAGMSLKQILRAATINNAREFHWDSELGSIEPGKIANLLLLKKSPLKTVEAYDSITTVWVRGRVIQRESLAADQATNK